MREDATTRAVGGQLHQTHLVAEDVGDVVMFRQPLVKKRVIAIQQLKQAAIFAQQVVERLFRFQPHGAAQIASHVCA